MQNQSMPCRISSTFSSSKALHSSWAIIPAAAASMTIPKRKHGTHFAAPAVSNAIVIMKKNNDSPLNNTPKNAFKDTNLRRNSIILFKQSLIILRRLPRFRPQLHDRRALLVHALHQGVVPFFKHAHRLVRAKHARCLADRHRRHRINEFSKRCASLPQNRSITFLTVNTHQYTTIQRHMMFLRLYSP